MKKASIKDHDPARRAFLGSTAKLAATAALAPVLGCAGKPQKPVATRAIPQIQPQSWETKPREPRFWVANRPERVLLKNGLIADGTGTPAYYGDLLISGDKIETVTPGSISFKGTALNCSGKVIAPGFIDCHTHMDWVLPMPGRMDMRTPFTEQGVTTFVGGNCGFGVAGFMKKTPHRELIAVRTEGLYNLQWDEMATYFDHIRRQGMSHNLVNLAGHGTTRSSIRGFDPTPLQPDEMRTLLYLLDQAMEQGAYGISLGLQYEPGVFATARELLEIARLVKKRDGILTVHMKAYSALSGTYLLKPYGRPHNLLALEEMIQLARETGVRLQLSHLIFVGERTWETCSEALDLITAARREGLDIQYDTYAYHCGTSVINVFLPKWFLSGVPATYTETTSLMRLRMEIMLIKSLLGFGFEDIQITDARHPDLDQFNGMFLEEIAKARGMDPFENFIDMARLSRGRARVLNHRYSSLENVQMLMQDPAALFQSDATPAPAGVQNPGAYGNFPLFLQYARDYRLMTMEACIRRMTGAAADRFGIRERGYLKAGSAADITVFDYDAIRDNNTRQYTDRRPSGIEHVFINGEQVLNYGLANSEILAGQVL